MLGSINLSLRFKFTSCTLSKFKVLKSQKNLQLNVPVVKSTFVFNYVVALLRSSVTEQNYSFREGVEKQRREKAPVLFPLFSISLQVDIL